MINTVIETSTVIKYLKKKNIYKQYLKSKSYIESGYCSLVDLKIRQPKHKGIWQFKMNDQYRAFCFYKDSKWRVYEIWDH